MNDGISRISCDDDFTYDESTVGFQSEAFLNKKGLKTPIRSGSDIMKKSHGSTQSVKFGSTELGNIWVADYWTDDFQRGRISLQVHLLSGSTAHMDWRISTDQKEIVLTSRLNNNLFDPNICFEKQIKKSFPQMPENFIKFVLKKHPKMKARGKTLKKVIGGSAAASKEFVTSQRIPLGKKVYRELAVQDKSDEFFFGEKYVKLDDGSSHLFLELVVDSGVPYQKHKYNPDEESILGSSVPTPTTKNVFKEKRSQDQGARIDGVDLIDEIIMNKDVNLEETTRKLIDMSEKSPE